MKRPPQKVIDEIKEEFKVFEANVDPPDRMKDTYQLIIKGVLEKHGLDPKEDWYIP